MLHKYDIPIKESSCDWSAHLHFAFIYVCLCVFLTMAYLGQFPVRNLYVDINMSCQYFSPAFRFNGGRRRNSMVHFSKSFNWSMDVLQNICIEPMIL